MSEKIAAANIDQVIWRNKEIKQGIERCTILGLTVCK